MSDFPILGGAVVIDGNATVNGDEITGGAAADLYGFWTQLVSALPSNADGFYLTVLPGYAGTGAGRKLAIDIGIGAAGSEQVLVEKILYQRPQRGRAEFPLYIPIQLSAGQRVSARCLGNAASPNCRIKVHLLQYGLSKPPSLQCAVTYGMTNSAGTQIDPGATPNTKGAYVQLIAATTRPINYLLLLLGYPNTSEPPDASWNIDLAVGAANSEQVIVDNFDALTDSVSDDLTPKAMGVPYAIPAGSRLAARCKSSTGDAAYRKIELAVIGVG